MGRRALSLACGGPCVSAPATGSDSPVSGCESVRRREIRRRHTPPLPGRAVKGTPHAVGAPTRGAAAGPRPGHPVARIQSCDARPRSERVGFNSIHRRALDLSGKRLLPRLFCWRCGGNQLVSIGRRGVLKHRKPALGHLDYTPQFIRDHQLRDAMNIESRDNVGFFARFGQFDPCRVHH